MKQMKSLSSFAALVLGLASPLCHAGGDGSGGGFLDHNGKKILKVTVAELSACAAWIESPELQGHPERRELLIQALKTIEVKPTESRVRAGQPLVMDYDLPNQRITALKPFFEGFMTSSVSDATIRSAETLILHEVAHLWGDDEDAADRFADQMIQSLANPVFSGSPADLCDDVEKGQLVTFVPEDARATNLCILSAKNRWCAVPDPFPSGNTQEACEATYDKLSSFARDLDRCLGAYADSPRSPTTSDSGGRFLRMVLHIHDEAMGFYRLGLLHGSCSLQNR